MRSIPYFQLQTALMDDHDGHFQRQGGLAVVQRHTLQVSFVV